MTELLTAIIMMCQVNAGKSSAFNVKEIQRDCQKYYVKCISDYVKAYTNKSKAIEQCIINRK